MHPPHIKEIIERTQFEYDQSELIEVVQYYIKKRKGRDVKIGIDNAFNMIAVINQSNQLSTAFDHARAWLLENQD